MFLFPDRSSLAIPFYSLFHIFTSWFPAPFFLVFCHILPGFTLHSPWFPAPFFLNSCFLLPGVLLYSFWFHVIFFLVFCSILPDFLLHSSWFPAPFLTFSDFLLPSLFPRFLISCYLLPVSCFLLLGFSAWFTQFPGFMLPSHWFLCLIYPVSWVLSLLNSPLPAHSQLPVYPVLSSNLLIWLNIFCSAESGLPGYGDGLWGGGGVIVKKHCWISALFATQDYLLR